MGKGTDELRSGDPGNREPEEIRAEIEDTRAAMGETIDEIQERMSPENIKEQARERVRDATIGRAEHVGESAKGAGISMWETVKQNPVPAALVGVGIGWLYKNHSQTSAHPGWQARGAMNYPPESRQYARSTGIIRDGEPGFGSRTSDTAEEYQQRVGELGDQMRHKSEHMSHQARHRAQEARGQLDRSFQENPLGLGLVALGAGLAVGLMVPETRQEDRLMGETRDHLVDQAKETAHDTAQRAQHVAEEAGRTAQEEAREQGLAE